MDDEIPVEELPKLQVITIMYSENDGAPPEVDLGETNPWLAVTLLEQVAAAISVTLIPPTIRYDGRVIFEAVRNDD
jgi:hypothetical protein